MQIVFIDILQGPQISTCGWELIIIIFTPLYLIKSAYFLKKTFIYDILPSSL
jgi:hypothetical protein